jgi:PTS system nitrogen regulatory IIA component
MRLAELVTPGQVAAELKSRSKLEVLEELAALLAVGKPASVVKDYSRVLVERERLRSTGVGSGVAIPHGKVQGLDRVMLAVGLSRRGIDFDAADGKPVNIFMALAAPVSSTGDHLKALARIARLCSDVDFRRRLLECQSDDVAYRLLIEEDERREQ